MIPQKYLEGNTLIAQKMGLPKLLQQYLVVYDKEVEIAKNRVLYLTQEIKKFRENSTSNNAVGVPFCSILAEILPL